MRYRFHTLDVFTDQIFGGNPLAVFTDARGISDARMQAVARELNLSETVFVLPPESGGTRRVRIFTPGAELPFAGHPTDLPPVVSPVILRQPFQRGWQAERRSPCAGQPTLGGCSPPMSCVAARCCSPPSNSR